MMIGRMRTRGLVAGGAVLALALTGCGTDVPDGPMDESQLESSYLTGRDVPEDWSLTSEPSGRDRYGDSVEEILPGESLVSEASGQCREMLDELNAETADVEYVADAEATYTNDGASVRVAMFSTQQEVDVHEPFLAMFDECEEEVLESIGPGVAPEDLRRESLDTESEGVALVSDEGSGSVLAFSTLSYGKNHLGYWAGSEDSRDLDAVVELVDAVQERFEEGPDAGEED